MSLDWDDQILVSGTNSTLKDQKGENFS